MRGKKSFIFTHDKMKKEKEQKYSSLYIKIETHLVKLCNLTKCVFNNY